MGPAQAVPAMVARHFRDIQITRRASTANRIGGQGEVYANQFTVRGTIFTLTGDKRFSADKQTLYATHRLLCFPSPVSSNIIRKTDRVSDGGTEYKIKFINDVLQYGQLLQIDLEETGH